MGHAIQLVVLLCVFASLRSSFLFAQEMAPACCGRQFVVTGIVDHRSLPPGVAITGAKDKETFADQVSGPEMLAEVPGLERGTYSVDIDMVELRYYEPGKRLMTITCEGQVLARDLDIAKAAGGEGQAYRFSAKVAHQGGSLRIEFVGHPNDAVFNAISVSDATGTQMACVTAKDLRPLAIPGADVIPDVPGPKRYLDYSLVPEVRAADLVSRLSLEEKVGQMSNGAPAIERLGVAQYNYWNECLHGVARAGQATVYPEPIGMAASWDVPLVGQVADAISTEARAKYADAIRHDNHAIYYGLTFWSPNINIFRDPRWGRGQETYGEDPFLTSQFAVAFIRGLQGNDPHYLKLVATAKHFAVHSGPEALRHEFNAVPPERDLYETYLPQFEAAVREAHVGSIMGAYNAVDDEPCCSSTLLLGDILRGRWGFTGYVVSDCGAIRDIWLNHKTVPTKAEAAARAVKAGCDLECGGDYSALTQAVNQGLISTAELDRALARLFIARFRLGMFDPPDRVPFSNIGMDQNCSPEHAALARKIADESMVLLKNDGTLPLDRTRLKKIAVIGPNLDTMTALYGNYNGVPVTAPTFLEALRAKVGWATQIVAMRGCAYAPSPGDLAVIPDLCLRHGSEAGLKAEYFTTPDLSGQPFLTRSDLAIDFAYHSTPHIPGYSPHHNSARWTGQIIAPEDGDYTIAVASRDSIRLWLDSQLVIDHWQEDDRPPQRAQLHLAKGQVVRLRLEYAHSDGAARCALLWNRADIDLTAQVVQGAQDADAIIFASGITGDIEGEEGSDRPPLIGFAGDRVGIELPAIQTKLIQALAATGKPVILVNFSGSAMAIPWEAEHLPAILQAWYPGQAGCAAIVDALLGDTNPGGRLPITFYKSTGDLPAFEDYAMTNRTYRYFTGKPLWAFGYGLSYTTFSYSGLALEKSSVGKSDTVRLSFDVANTGSRDGDEVAQVYVRRPSSGPGDPVRSLCAFSRVNIGKGQTKHVELTFPAASLRRWDTGQHGYVVDSGQYKLEIGASSDDARLTAAVDVVN